MVLRFQREVDANPRLIVLRSWSEDGFECCHYGCVELAFNRLRESHSVHRARHSIPIRTIGGHRVVCIGHSKDSRDDWNFVPYESVGISLSVHPFVVVTNDSGDVEVIVNLGENALPDLRVRFHEPPFLERKRARFFEETCRKSYLPDVVYEAACVGKPRLGLS